MVAQLIAVLVRHIINLTMENVFVDMHGKPPWKVILLSKDPAAPPLCVNSCPISLLTAKGIIFYQIQSY